jgi:hypothetical protein
VNSGLTASPFLPDFCMYLSCPLYTPFFLLSCYASSITGPACLSLCPDARSQFWAYIMKHICNCQHLLTRTTIRFPSGSSMKNQGETSRWKDTQSLLNRTVNVVWEVVPCSLAKTDRRFKEAYCFHHQAGPHPRQTTFIPATVRTWDITLLNSYAKTAKERLSSFHTPKHTKR